MVGYIISTCERGIRWSASKFCEEDDDVDEDEDEEKLPRS